MSPEEMETAVKNAGQVPASFGTPDGSPEQMEQAAKAFQSMSPEDMENMVGQMASLTPEQKKEMERQGLNPGMMEMMAKMAKSNPAGLKQAQQMMEMMAK